MKAERTYLLEVMKIELSSKLLCLESSHLSAQNKKKKRSKSLCWTLLQILHGEPNKFFPVNCHEQFEICKL